MWIPSHKEVARHPKTRKLARALHITRVQTIGHLHMLWWWCLDYAQDGNISDFDAEEIADACEYEDGDPVDFLAALVSSGFVDVDKNGVKRLHNWNNPDRAGGMLTRMEVVREGNKKRQQDWRERHKDDQRNALRNSDVTAMSLLRNGEVTALYEIREDKRIEDPDRTISDPSDHDPSTTQLEGSIISPSARVENVQPSVALRDGIGAIDSASYRNVVRELLRIFGVDKPSPKALDQYSVVLHGYCVRDVDRVRAQCVTAAEWLQNSRKNTKNAMLSPGWMNNWLDRNFNPKPTPPQPTNGGGIDDATTTAANEQRRRDRVHADEAKRQARVNQSSDRLQRISDMVEERQRRAIS